MVLHKDTRHMDMHLLPKTLTCIMGAFLDMGITNSQGLTNSHSRSVNFMFFISLFNVFSMVLVFDNRDMSVEKLDGYFWLFNGLNCMQAMYNIILCVIVLLGIGDVGEMLFFGSFVHLH